MDKTVSIVIPVYNTAPYLDACIESVLRQTYPHLEILLVNDGSTDESPGICDNWALCDRRIRVIHTPNQGLGLARNEGLDAATGQFICFFDSDDYIAPDTIEKALGTAASQDADIVLFGITSVNRNGKIVSTILPASEPAVYRGEAVTECFLPELIGPLPGNSPRFYMSACLMLYSLPRLRQWDWHFVSEREIISEDVYSLLQLFKFVQTVAILPDALYFYRTNENSLSRHYRPDRYRQIRHFYLASVDLCHRMGYNQAVADRLASPYLAYTIAAIKQEANANRPLAQRLQAIHGFLQDDVLQQVLQHHSNSGNPARQLMCRMMGLRWTFPCFSLAWVKNRVDSLRR